MSRFRLKVGPLLLTLHRTVRVSDGRTSAALPPSLGQMDLYPVSEYRDKCPKAWEDDAVFVVLHETEALWISFSYTEEAPIAVLLGAGGRNAVSGKHLTKELEKDGYMVVPPQPWIDGWKNEDGSVYQFVATEYKQGEGNTVAEQLDGVECESGAIGIAVFEPLDRTKLKTVDTPGHSQVKGLSFAGPTKGVARGMGGQSFREMGVGKGGKITQKIYPDPHGLDVWKQEPVGVKAIYLVGAEAFKKITGIDIPKPTTHQNYSGPQFEMEDENLKDVAGTDTFTGLKTAFKDPPPDHQEGENEPANSEEKTETPT